VTNFAITWDYRCPYARNANEHVIAALLGGEIDDDGSGNQRAGHFGGD